MSEAMQGGGRDAARRVARLSRRAVLAGAGAVAVPWPAWARDGFVVDWQGGERTPALAASLQAQVPLVEALPVSSDAMDFFPPRGDPRRPRAGHDDAGTLRRVFRASSSRRTIRCCSTS